MAEISKTPIPVCNITFPPGFLEVLANIYAGLQKGIFKNS